MTEDTERLDVITNAVSEVALAQTGRAWRPAPDEPLFGPGRLLEIHATPLALAIQEATGAVLRAEDSTPRGLATVRTICELVERR